MALKYYLEYTDLEKIEHRVEIDDPDYMGSQIQVNGYVSLQSGSVNSPIESFRGQGLKLYLEASIDLTFNDLYSENDRVFKVTYIRDSITQFVGFLNPEGLFEDYVSDKWMLTLICGDGLSFLKTLSYVDNITNELFRGKQSELEIITNCLKRTDLGLNINTSIGISYGGQTANTDVLSQTYLNSERFLKEDNQQTVMQCEEVLRSILEKYNAVIQFRNGEWFIYRPIELFNFSSRTFYKYNSNGTTLSPVTVDINLTTNLGSQIDEYYPHWVNSNQKKNTKNSIGAYRVNYKYGLVSNVLDNPTLLSDDGDLFNYTINEPTLVEFPVSERGIRVKGSSGNVSVAVSDPVNISDQDSIQVTFVQKSGDPTANVPHYVKNNAISYRVALTDGSTTYYLQSDGSWTTTVINLTIDTVFIGYKTLVLKSGLVPITGTLTVDIRDSREEGSDSSVEITLIDVRPTTTEEGGVKGEVHTVQRIANPSSKILPNKEIFNGDVPTDLYEGTIYKADQTTPTTVWNRTGVVEESAILRIMAEDTLSMFQSPSIEFSGDIYGFIPCMSRILINNQPGIYIPIEYEYKTNINITSLKLRQIFGFLGSDIDYELTFDYGNVVEPTIRR